MRLRKYSLSLLFIIGLYLHALVWVITANFISISIKGNFYRYGDLLKLFHPGWLLYYLFYSAPLTIMSLITYLLFFLLIIFLKKEKSEYYLLFYLCLLLVIQTPGVIIWIRLSDMEKQILALGAVLGNIIFLLAFVPFIKRSVEKNY